MSKATNNFPRNSGIKLKCIHSKKGEYPLIKPGDDPMVLPEIGGNKGYLVIKAMKSERENIPSKIDDIYLNVTSITGRDDVPEYEIILKYGWRLLWGHYCHKIKAKKKKNKKKDDWGACQTNVNVEIGPIDP